jgi:hypothetical protein
VILLGSGQSAWALFDAKNLLDFPVVLGALINSMRSFDTVENRGYVEVRAP